MTDDANTNDDDFIPEPADLDNWYAHPLSKEAHAWAEEFFAEFLAECEANDE